MIASSSQIAVELDTKKHNRNKRNLNEIDFVRVKC